MNRERKVMKADHTTWCRSDVKAGVNLAKILNEIGDSSLISKVNVHVHRLTGRLCALNSIDDISYRQYFMKSTFHDSIMSVKLAMFPESVTSHLSNVLTAKYRQKLRESDEQRS
jgi:hypothetical protein